jgi:serine/threonine protein kinase
MIDNDGEPILMDFGLARNMDDDVRISRSGASTGSPAYMSPEQASGDQSKVGTPTDLYSLGVILFEILTGKIPFNGSVISVLQKIVNEPPPRPAEVRPEIQQDPGLNRLQQLSLKLMSKSPADRYVTAAAAADALDTCLQNLGSGTAGPKGPAWRRFLRPFLSK